MCKQTSECPPITVGKPQVLNELFLHFNDFKHLVHLQNFMMRLNCFKLMHFTQEVLGFLPALYAFLGFIGLQRITFMKSCCFWLY